MKPKKQKMEIMKKVRGPNSKTLIDEEIIKRKGNGKNTEMGTV